MSNLSNIRENNPSRRVNLQPSFWGPSAWKFLYTVALGYPNDPTPEEKQAAANLLEGLHFLLPCHNCRENVSREIENFPYAKALENQGQFTRYVYVLENSVGVRLGKQKTPTFRERLQQIYDDMDGGGGQRRHSRQNTNKNGDDNGDNGDSEKSNSCSVSQTVFIILLVSLFLAGLLLGWGITFGVVKSKKKK